MWICNAYAAAEITLAEGLRMALPHAG